jgi:hypothetical protein
MARTNQRPPWLLSSPTANDTLSIPEIKSALKAFCFSSCVKENRSSHPTTSKKTEQANLRLARAATNSDGSSRP